MEIDYASAAQAAMKVALQEYIDKVIGDETLELTEQNAELQRRITKAVEDLEESLRVNTEQGQTITHLETALAAKEKELADCRASWQELSDLIVEKNVTIMGLREELAAKDARITQLLAEIDQLKMAKREALVPGTYKPSDETTGCLNYDSINETFTAEKVYDCAVIGGMVIENKRFQAQVKLVGSSTKKIIFRNCVFEGGGPNKMCLALNQEGVRDVWVIDCDISPRPDLLTESTDCVGGHHYTLVRCNIWGGIDCVGIWNAQAVELSVAIIACWLHDVVYFSPCSYQQSNDTHNDLIQIRSGHDVYILGCFLDAMCDTTRGNIMEPARVDSTGKHLGGNKHYPYTHAACSIQITDPYGRPMRGLRVDFCWVFGGAIGFNFVPTGGGYLGSVRGCRIGSNFRNGADHFIYYNTGTKDPAQKNSFTYELCVRDATGAAFTVLKRGDY